MFEMLCGYPPFYDENPFGIYQKILVGKPIFLLPLRFHDKLTFAGDDCLFFVLISIPPSVGKIDFPKHVDEYAKDIIKRCYSPLYSPL